MKDSCVKICLAVVVVLLFLSLGGNTILSYFVKTIIPFTPGGVLKLFDDCSQCPACLVCQTGFTGENMEAICDPFSNIFQCAVQLIYLYNRPDYGQPCYKECHACQSCLDKTTFGSLGRLNQTLWQTVFPSYFNSPEKEGYKNYTITCPGTREGAMCDFKPNKNQSGPVNNPNQMIAKTIQVQSTDLCCGTLEHRYPYTFEYNDPHTDDTWYPVWFYYPWHSPAYSYQWYYDVTCQYMSPLCSDSLFCNLENRTVTFLMTTKMYSPVYGYTFQYLVMPDPKVKFIDVSLASFCQCVR